LAKDSEIQVFFRSFGNLVTTQGARVKGREGFCWKKKLGFKVVAEEAGLS